MIARGILEPMGGVRRFDLIDLARFRTRSAPSPGKGRLQSLQPQARAPVGRFGLSLLFHRVAQEGESFVASLSDLYWLIALLEGLLQDKEAVLRAASCLNEVGSRLPCQLLEETEVDRWSGVDFPNRGMFSS